RFERLDVQEWKKVHLETVGQRDSSGPGEPPATARKRWNRVDTVDDRGAHAGARKRQHQFLLKHLTRPVERRTMKAWFIGNDRPDEGHRDAGIRHVLIHAERNLTRDSAGCMPRRRAPPAAISRAAVTTTALQDGSGWRMAIAIPTARTASAPTLRRVSPPDSWLAGRI